MEPCKTPCVHIMLQILKTWHLVCVVCGVTGVGLLLLLARTVAQTLTDPDLVTNKENPEGVTVSRSCLFHTTYGSRFKNGKNLGHNLTVTWLVSLLKHVYGQLQGAIL